MRVLVVTIVHRPDDARILHRQIAALRKAGHEVVYAAPFTGWDTPLPVGLRCIDLPRAAGRRRVTAIRAARRLLRSAAMADVVLLHDPELLLAADAVPDGPVVVWDVHEDTAAALTLKAWLPGFLRRPTATVVRAAERIAERRVRLLLAEDGYRSRFGSEHPVVPNSTPVPIGVAPPGQPDPETGLLRCVYIGHLSAARGARELVELGRELRPDNVDVELIGHADGPTAELLRAADDTGAVRWLGYLPNDSALQRVEGALAGLSLLHDEPNYRHSRPTKIIEYMARGVPVITTPTPPAVALVESAGCGTVVPFVAEHPDQAAGGTVIAAAAAVRTLRDDPEFRTACAAGGRAAALRDHDWNTDGPAFVRLLESWAAAR